MAKHVLIVDDDINIRTAVKLRLERDALIVHTASDGEDALRQVEQQSPDLVILDLFLPRRDGIEVLACIKNTAATADIPVIVLTARYHCGDADAEQLARANEVIVKPFSPRYLAERVHHLLN